MLLLHDVVEVPTLTQLNALGKRLLSLKFIHCFWVSWVLVDSHHSWLLIVYSLQSLAEKTTLLTERIPFSSKQKVQRVAVRTHSRRDISPAL